MIGLLWAHRTGTCLHVCCVWPLKYPTPQQWFSTQSLTPAQCCFLWVHLWRLLWESLLEDLGFGNLEELA